MMLTNDGISNHEMLPTVGRLYLADSEPELSGTKNEDFTVKAQATPDTAAFPIARQGGFTRLPAIYLELAKAKLATMVVLTTVVGYVVAARGHADLAMLALCVVGTSLSAFGANILNQRLEIERDRLMERTRGRPLPAGQVSKGLATAWGALSSIAGLAILEVGVNTLTAMLSLLVISLYVFVYTPLKVRTPFATLVGAICGAVPPMMGWTAATGRLDLGAWILGGILFCWQVPHFLALAWLYREDYERGGFRMLPAVDRTGSATGIVSLVYALALLPLSVFATIEGLAGSVFLVAGLALGTLFALAAGRMVTARSTQNARRLFFASLLYLPLLMGVMVADMDQRLLRAFVEPVDRVETIPPEAGTVSDQWNVPRTGL